MNKSIWLSYPENKPAESNNAKKAFYHAQLVDQYFDGYAYKVWYSDGLWLCDLFETVVKVKSFKPCFKNSKHEIEVK